MGGCAPSPGELYGLALRSLEQAEREEGQWGCRYARLAVTYAIMALAYLEGVPWPGDPDRAAGLLTRCKLPEDLRSCLLEECPRGCARGVVRFVGECVASSV